MTPMVPVTLECFLFPRVTRGLGRNRTNCNHNPSHLDHRWDHLDQGLSDLAMIFLFSSVSTTCPSIDRPDYCTVRFLDNTAKPRARPERHLLTIPQPIAIGNRRRRKTPRAALSFPHVTTRRTSDSTAQIRRRKVRAAKKEGFQGRPSRRHGAEPGDRSKHGSVIVT